MDEFKTPPYAHQLEALRRSEGRREFALLMEQGTGKSKVAIDDTARLRRGGKIDSLLILAPKGVAPTWLRQQLPTHTPDDIDYAAALWRSKSNLTKTGARALKAMIGERDKLRIAIMNLEAFGSGTDAIDFAIDFLDSARSAKVIVDESHRIKNPAAHSTKRILTHIPPRSTYRRILTGTIGAKPFDLFSQFGFLSPKILQQDSFVAFKREYAEFLPESAGLMRHILRRVPKKWTGEYNPDGSKEMKPAYVPQIVASNADGTPRYKNLERLHDLIAPHSYRALKRDCLDLPEKIYNRYYTELAPRQRELYDEVEETQRIEWENGEVSVFSKLTTYLRLQQIICGYIPAPPDPGTLEIDERRMRNLFPSWRENPRILSALELIEDRPPEEKTIVWCRFIEDIKRMTEALTETYGKGSCVQFYGGIGDRARIENIERFEGERVFLGRGGEVLRRERVPEEERPRFLLAQERAGGVGQTWVAASLSLHYSNSFSLIDRLQAEDRPHRIGQRNVVQYVDLEAENTIDSRIIASLLAGKNVADTIQGDDPAEWLSPIEIGA